MYKMNGWIKSNKSFLDLISMLPNIQFPSGLNQPCQLQIIPELIIFIAESHYVCHKNSMIL